MTKKGGTAGAALFYFVTTGDLIVFVFFQRRLLSVLVTASL